MKTICKSLSTPIFFHQASYKRIQEHSVFLAVVALIQFNKDVFVSQHDFEIVRTELGELAPSQAESYEL